MSEKRLMEQDHSLLPVDTLSTKPSRRPTKTTTARFAGISKHALVLLACLIVLRDSWGGLVDRFDGVVDRYRKKHEHHRHHDPSNPFHFRPCDPHSPLSPYKCGHLLVPLDYTNTSDTRQVKLAITLYQADPHKKSEKTLLVNPGGPGGSGTNLVYRRGEFFSLNMTGGVYDVLGWDPRGVNQSTPAISCFPKDAYRDRWSLLLGEYAESAGEQQIVLVDAMNEAVMKGCHESIGDLGRFMTTAFVARDVDEIRKALGLELVDGMGISYGTGIFQTYQQMFPDNVGRMVMDGMEYAVDGRKPWQWGTTSLDNVTALYEDGFLGECITAGPSRCALANTSMYAAGGAETAKRILGDKMETLFEGLEVRPIPGYVASSGPGIVTYGSAVGLLYQALYRPDSWPKVAQTFAGLLEGNGSLALEAISSSFSFDPEKNATVADPPFPHHWSVKPSASAELDLMVVCGDGYDAEKHDLEWWIDLRRDMTKKSFLSANSRFYNTLSCRHFDWDVAEVYRGDFKHRLRTPTLLISQTYDPATPLRNGRILAQEMGPENARFIIHHGYGHSSRAQPSACVDKIVSAYWLNGTLPTEFETECWADEAPYPITEEDGEVAEFDLATLWTGPV